MEAEQVSAHSVSPVENAAPTEQQTDVVLQPGNSALRAFTLRTKKEITFTPSTYTLHIQVKYQMSDMLNHDTVEHQLSIRAPLKALIYGSTFGAWTGVALRNFYAGGAQFTPSFAGAAEYAASALLAAVIVIAFARKKDTQPFIAIEDFWGGFFVGFVAGYVGEAMLDGLIPTAT